MKSAKIVGIVFAVCGILFAIIGTVSGIVRLMEKDDCKYAAAYIVKIGLYHDPRTRIFFK